MGRKPETTVDAVRFHVSEDTTIIPRSRNLRSVANNYPHESGLYVDVSHPSRNVFYSVQDNYVIRVQDGIVVVLVEDQIPSSVNVHRIDGSVCVTCQPNNGPVLGRSTIESQPGAYRSNTVNGGVMLLTHNDIIIDACYHPCLFRSKRQLELLVYFQPLNHSTMLLALYSNKIVLQSGLNSFSAIYPTLSELQV